MKHLKIFEDVAYWGDESKKPTKEEKLRRSRQDKIDEFDSYFKNLKILKSYIDKLSKSYEINKIMLTYAIILHNFIILERRFSNEVKKNNCEINKYLDIAENSSTYWINAKLVELYDPEHMVRNKVEKLDEVKPIGDFLKSNPEIYKRVYTEDEIDILLQSNKYNL